MISLFKKKSCENTQARTKAEEMKAIAAERLDRCPIEAKKLYEAHVMAKIKMAAEAGGGGFEITWGYQVSDHPAELEYNYVVDLLKADGFRVETSGEDYRCLHIMWD